MDDVELAERIVSVIYEVRGKRVILDADAASFFETKTGRVNQYRKRNAHKFGEKYAFELTPDEWDALKSQNVISTSHGGRRTLPWAYTEHGFTRLSMGMNGEKAELISDAVIDTFVSYRNGTLVSGPVLSGPNARPQRRILLDAIYSQMQQVAAMPLPTGANIGEELQSVTAGAIARIKAVIDAPVVRQEQLMAEIAKVEAETSKTYAEVQKLEAETAKIWVDVLQGRLDAVVKLRDMAEQLERDEAVDLIGSVFDTETAEPGMKVISP